LHQVGGLFELNVKLRCQKFNFLPTVLFTLIQQFDTKPIQSVLITWTLLTYSIGQSLSEAKRFSASQEIPRNLWRPKVPYRVYKCPPPAISSGRLIQSIAPIPLRDNLS